MKVRWTIIFFVLVTSLILAFPNFFDVGEGWIFSKRKITYGLDIQGGLHLVMGVDVKGVIEEKIKRTARALGDELQSKKVSFKKVNTLKKGSSWEIEVLTEKRSQFKGVREYIEKFHGYDLQEVQETRNSLFYRFYDMRVGEFKKQVIDQAIEVLRNRVDEFGVAEPVIVSQGDSRILVQLPGVEDSHQAKSLIYKTARLYLRPLEKEFDWEKKLPEWVSEAEIKGGYALGDKGLSYSKYVKRINEDIKGKLPQNAKVVFEKNPAAKDLATGKIPYLVRTDTNLGGDLIEDAQVRLDEYGQPEVNFRFSVEGRRLFSEMTEQNVNNRVAIVLDEVVKSAPVIKEKINSDSARIQLGTGDYDTLFKEAQLIATSLRAGALPAALEPLEERTVGPSLGADAIEKGKKAGLIGGILVLIFILLYYRFLGFVADIALGFSLLLILAALTSLGATLTLPGVAGIVLTIGMAVDANVIIFERIKEELRKKASPQVAVKDGFRYAFSAIFDANLTTIFVCIVLMYFGTGPVRGFAVTLICGILTSLFTSIFFSRTLIDFFLVKMKWKKLC